MSIGPRWQKMIRDFTGDRGRALLLLSAVSVGIFGVSTILSTYSILIREIKQNYMGTNPASATIDLGEVTDAVLATARSFPGVAEVEARRVSLSRVKVGEDWLRLLLFVVDDFGDMRLNTFRKVSGQWPPPTGSMLVEHTALRVLRSAAGGSVLVKTPHGSPTRMTIAGVVHDATLAPAWQEKAGYGYVTRETFAALGEPPILDELRVQLTGNPASLSQVEATVQALAGKLQGQGHVIHEIRVPPPRTHPHQNQMQGVLFLFIVFAVMALVLSAILVATIVAAMLTKQVREIGMMKAVGARSAQIARMYLSMLLALGVVSVAIGLPAGIVAGWMFADMVAVLLNIVIHSYAASPWVYAVVVSSGLLVPVLVALPVIVKGSRLTVREAIADFGVDITKAFGGSVFDMALVAMHGIGLSYRLAIRNMFRRRGRLVMALALLAAGGGMFMTGLNIRDGWAGFVDRVFTDRFYDVEFTLNEATSTARIEAVLATVAKVRKAEFWGFSPTAVAQKGRVDVSRAYPDGAHGSFSLLGIPPDTGMIRFPVLAGRWLQNGDVDAVVLNQTAKMIAGGPALGDAVVLSLDGAPKTWRLVGVVEEIGAPGVAYVSDHAFEAAAGSAGRARMVRVATAAGSPAERQALIRKIDDALLEAGISVRLGLPLTVLHGAMGDHVLVLVRMLIAAAILFAVIGVLGLTSTMTMNVIDRTRELGIMRATGATPQMVLKIVVGEGVSISLMSWLLALLLSLPLSQLVGSIVGNMAFRTPLALTVSHLAVVLWLLLVVVMAALATMIPARRASKRAVHEALAYE